MGWIYSLRPQSELEAGEGDQPHHQKWDIPLPPGPPSLLASPSFVASPRIFGSVILPRPDTGNDEPGPSLDHPSGTSQRLSERGRWAQIPPSPACNGGALVFVSCSLARAPQMSGVARLFPCPSSSFLHGRVQPGLALPPLGREEDSARAPPTAMDQFPTWA